MKEYMNQAEVLDYIKETVNKINEQLDCQNALTLIDPYVSLSRRGELKMTIKTRDELNKFLANFTKKCFRQSMDYDQVRIACSVLREMFTEYLWEDYEKLQKEVCKEKLRND